MSWDSILFRASCLEISDKSELRTSYAQYRPTSPQRGIHESTRYRFGHICIAGAVQVRATRGAISASHRVTLNPPDDQTQRLNI